MAVCARCGEANPERARFCLTCGAALAPARPRRDERKVVSVLFCDLVGFTSRAERLDVEDVRGVLRPYYSRVRRELERHGGTVEKFIGDAVMALFGAPTAREDDPERAVRAALAIELQQRAHAAAERFGLAASLRWLQSERILHDYWRGDWEAARSGADRLIAEAEEGLRADSDGLCRLGRGSIRLARGDLAGALADAAAGVELAETTGYLDKLPALAFQARVLVAGGRHREAEAVAGQGLAVVEEHGVLPMDPDWSGNLAVALHALGHGAELAKLLARARTPTRWLAAATSVAAGDFGRAAELYAEIGSLPDEAYARLRAAGPLLDAGRRAEGMLQLRRALAVYRKVQATAYLGEGEAQAATAQATPRHGLGAEPTRRRPGRR